MLSIFHKLNRFEDLFMTDLNVISYSVHVYLLL